MRVVLSGRWNRGGPQETMSLNWREIELILSELLERFKALG